MINFADYFLCMRVLLFLLGLLMTVPTFAQRGLNLQGGVMGGLSFISPQNHYDNPTFELDYVNTLGYNGSFSVGYGFRRSPLGLQAEVAYTAINQNYKGTFSPGYNLPNNQVHEKEVKLNYISTTIFMRYAPKLGGTYVIDKKVQLHVLLGIQLSVLAAAKGAYSINGTVKKFPEEFNFNPFVNPDYAYQNYAPVTKETDYYSRINSSLVLQAGIDWFVSDKFCISPAIRGQVSFNDINAKPYRIHDDYKASRAFLGGLYIGVGYFFSRG